MKLYKVTSPIAKELMSTESIYLACDSFAEGESLFRGKFGDREICSISVVSNDIIIRGETV